VDCRPIPGLAFRRVPQRQVRLQFLFILGDAMARKPSMLDVLGGSAKSLSQTPIGAKLTSLRKWAGRPFERTELRIAGLENKLESVRKSVEQANSALVEVKTAVCAASPTPKKPSDRPTKKPAKSSAPPLGSKSANDRLQVAVLGVRAHGRKHGAGLKDTFRLGATVTLDPSRSEIIGNDAATALLGRSYRAPYVVPPPDQV
jgi:hypothetical protein